ncbi:MAG: tetratricopeptide repeat protein [Flavobacteriales bacterium]|nr:tetratricopeptide repeat protein [Flavobacteriales bacterium]
MRSVLFLVPCLALLACTGDEPAVDTVPAKPSASLTEVEQRILADPTNPVLFAERAMFHERMDSLRLAENDWKRAIALDSTNATWRIALGDLYFRKIKLLDAEQRFQEAIALEPDSTEGRSKLGEVYLMQLRFKEAMIVANDALRLDPLDARLYNLKGWIHRTAGDTALAISSYQTAIERDPGYYDAYISLGILHAAKNDPLAMEYYNSALEVQPRSVEALYNKAMFAQEHGSDSTALACYGTIKEIEPNYPLAYYNTGYILLEHKRLIPQARAEFNKAIEMLPDYTQAYFSRGLTYELQNMLDSAIFDYSQVLRLDPGNTEAAQGLSRMQAKGKKVKVR